MIAVALTLALADPARANVGKPDLPGHPAGEPLGLIPVAVVGETLVIDMRPLADGGPVRVAAEYRLDNRGPERQLDLGFVSGSGTPQAFVASFDGRSIDDIAPSQIDVPASWIGPQRTPALGGGQPLVYSQTKGDVMAFRLDVPPGRHVLAVRYVSAAGTNLLGEPTKYHQFGYVLAPANSWESFGGLDLTVPPAGRLAGGRFPELGVRGRRTRGRFEGVPANDFAITVQAEPGRAYDIVRRATLGLIGAVGVVGGVLCYRAGRRGRWRRALAAAGLWGAALCGAGLLAVYAADWTLPAGQATHYGYGQGIAALGSGLLGLVVFGLGGVYALALGTRTARPPGES